MTARERAVVASVARARRRRRGPAIDPAVLVTLRRMLDEMDGERDAKPAPTFERRGRELSAGPSLRLG